MNQNNNLCRNCGCPLKLEDRFCKNCGMAVGNTQVLNNDSNQGMTNPNNDYNAWQNNQSMPVQQNMNQSNQPVPNNNYNPYQNNPNNYRNSIPKNKTNSTGKYIIIGLVAFVLVGIAVYLILTMQNDNSRYTPSTPTTKTTPTTPTTPTTQTNTTKTISYGGFTFKIPSNYISDTSSDGLTISDSSDTWAILLEVIPGDYNKLINNRNTVISGIKSTCQDCVVSTYDQKVYSGMNCITMETTKQGYKMLLGYVKANSSKIFVVNALNQANTYDYDLFAKAVEILKTGV